MNYIPTIWYIAPIGAIVSLIFAYMFFRAVKKRGSGK